MRNKSKLLSSVGISLLKNAFKSIIFQIKLMQSFYKRIEAPLEKIITTNRHKYYAIALTLIKRHAKKVPTKKSCENWKRFYRRYIFKLIKNKAYKLNFAKKL